MAEIIQKYWAIIAAFVSVVVWAVRVEAGMNANRKEITNMWKARKEDNERHDRERTDDRNVAKESRDEMKQLLAEVRSDIKTILGRI